MPDYNFVDDKKMVRYIAKTEDEHSHAVTLRVYQVTAWDGSKQDAPDIVEEVAIFYVKWDGCAHIGFRDPTMSKEWVHVCGVREMEMVLRMMAWAWNIAKHELNKRGFTDGLTEINLICEGVRCALTPGN